MCEIIAFPNKKLISKEVEDRLYKVACDYVDILFEAMEAYIDDDDYDIEGMEAVYKMAAKIYAEGLEVAIDALEAELELDLD